jgi:hypothetical protein
VAKYYDEDEAEETTIDGFTMYFQEELAGIGKFLYLEVFLLI